MSPQNTNQEASRSAQLTNDWKAIFKWLFILGGLAAGVMNVLVVNAIITPDAQYSFFVTALMIIGIVVGIFHFDSNDVINVGLRFMIFSAVANSISGFHTLGDYLAPFFMGFAYYLGPIVLTMLVVYFVKKYLLNK